MVFKNNHKREMLWGTNVNTHNGTVNCAMCPAPL